MHDLMEGAVTLFEAAGLPWRKGAATAPADGDQPIDIRARARERSMA